MREYFEIRPSEPNGWGFYNSDDVLNFWADDKQPVIDYAEDVLKTLWVVFKIKSELRIKEADGTIGDPRTYGDDPVIIQG